MKIIAIVDLFRILQKEVQRNSLTFVCIKLMDIATKDAITLKDCIRKIENNLDDVCQIFSNLTRLKFIENAIEIIENYDSIDIEEDELVKLLILAQDKTEQELPTIFIQSQNQ